jgi:hypothetical protein
MFPYIQSLVINFSEEQFVILIIWFDYYEQETMRLELILQVDLAHCFHLNLQLINVNIDIIKA